MRLYNSLTKKIEDFKPTAQDISIYSCGPTVYDNLHIGNLASFIYADLLRRTLKAAFPKHTITHVMNITDVDDKTIRDSKNSSDDPMSSLLTFTQKYEKIFKDDMARVGNDMGAYTFIRATDSIEEMLEIVRELYHAGIAYITDDGIYFSIQKYRDKGKTYGQLVSVSTEQAAQSRIANDEYDKDSAQDFALWKIAKEGEPSWEFTLDDKDLSGRPGWHIECSAMSRKLLGAQFDIHTGGIDLKFPHHENEIAQSTAASDSDTMARFFVHSEHILVNGTKMSKSLGNFYTLRDIEDKGFDSAAFRLLVLQGHYRNSVNFTWESLEAASNRLDNWKQVAALRWQASAKGTKVNEVFSDILLMLESDLDTPSALAKIDEYFNSITLINPESQADFELFLSSLNTQLGIDLLSVTPDISEKTKALLSERSLARKNKDWAKSDQLRDQLKENGVEVRDNPDGQTWTYSSAKPNSEYFSL